MNELEEIMNGKHQIKHLKIDKDTLSFNTELDNYDWNLTPRDIEMIIYTLQEDKNNLQSKIDKAIDKINLYELITGYYDSNYDGYYDTYSHEIKEELLDILKEDK